MRASSRSSRLAVEEPRLYASVEADYRGASEREAMLRDELERQRQVVAAYEDKAIDFKIMRREVDTNRDDLREPAATYEGGRGLRGDSGEQHHAARSSRRFRSSLLRRRSRSISRSRDVGAIRRRRAQRSSRSTWTTRSKTPEEVERYLRLPMLGAIPEFKIDEEARTEPATSVPICEVTLQSYVVGMRKRFARCERPCFSRRRAACRRAC